jgi:YD repeat-containing protein
MSRRGASWGTTAILSLGAAVYLCLIFSPRFVHLLLVRGLSFDSYVTEKAVPRECALVRRGNVHADAVVCTLDYNGAGKPVSARALVWESDSAFNTLAVLHRRLAAFSDGRPIDVDLDVNRLHGVDRPQYVPQAWFQASVGGLDMLVLVGLFVAAFIVSGKLTDRPGRRADYEYDEQGNLVLKRARTWRKWPPRLAVWLLWCLLLLAMLYALTNRPANHRLFVGRALVEVPGILVDCARRYTGGRKGHDQIECDVIYEWQGRKLRGQAEAVDFRWFPTAGRLDLAAESAEGRHVPAYVDPAQPGYAIAFVNDDVFVPYSLGLSDIVLVAWFFGLTLFVAAAGFARER